MEKRRTLTKDIKLDYLGQGYGFKDYDAYKNDWDKVCYIPELATGDEYVEEGDMYTHNDLLKLCKECEVTKDNYYNECDYMFGELDWCYPETFLADMDN